ncbi:translation initiation factor eIF3g [Guyanagaster necrorhizus]|uniref:Eukaryotic translation initiation factor 3 subunit G n=1 Tax=Guyanagaster necrorhizus TaxID=856835 RepID=A0A9P7VNB2_9AGAR|nr:translation initiation factor eIF3g [Guyanagaster necrorhizus MCA 3950]KAG7444343.1 translation initiation factor eIF3g [Guyanagaster necrorhizus MCA 3950]
MSAYVTKTSWADEIDELEAPIQKISDSVDENGIRTTVEYVLNDEGKKVKITRRIKRTLQKATVDPKIAQRQKWAKFGQERGNKPGPDRATTTVGENVGLKLSVGNKSSDAEPTQEESMKSKLAKSGAGKVNCRICKGDHFTAKCPYKDTLGALDNPDTGAGPDDGLTSDATPSAPATTGGKYVPPSMRAGASRPGESMRGLSSGGNRDDYPTLRVTNVSEDTQENDLRELFQVFGRIMRVYVGRDRETGAGKGFAFVSFDERAHAQRAMEKMNGFGYDNLILSVQWSQPRPEQR